ncbi:MAG: hypothetical protein FWD77_04260 [Betaproteobacteria bacterium]|nr:hypothetical protein [Betaproteobacteria bacterium]
MFSISQSRALSRTARACSFALCLGLLSALSLPLHADDLHISGGGGGGGGGGGTCGGSLALAEGNGGGGGGGGGIGSGNDPLYADYLGGGGGGGSGSGINTGNSVGGNGGYGSSSFGNLRVGGNRGGVGTGRTNGEDGGADGDEGGKGGQAGSAGRLGGNGGQGSMVVYSIWSPGMGGAGGNGSNGPGSGNSSVSGSNGGGGGGGGGGGCSAPTIDPTSEKGGNGGDGAPNDDILLLDPTLDSLIISGGGGGDGGTAGSTNGGGGGGGGSITVDAQLGITATTLTVSGGDGGRGNVSPVAKESHALQGVGGAGGTGGCNTTGPAAPCYGYGGGGGYAALIARDWLGMPELTIATATGSLTVQSGAMTRVSNSYGGGHGGSVSFDVDSLEAPPIINVTKQDGALSFKLKRMDVRTPATRMLLTATASSDVQINGMNFYLPEPLKAGSTMLSILRGSGAAAFDASSLQIEVGVLGFGSSLKIGDEIVLIDGVTGARAGSTSVGAGMEVPSQYIFDISQRGSQIIATVTRVPPVLTEKVINPGEDEVDFSVVSSLGGTGYWKVLPWTFNCPDAAALVSGSPPSEIMYAGQTLEENWSGPPIDPGTLDHPFYTLCFVVDAGPPGNPNYSAVWQGWFAVSDPSGPILLDLEIDADSITSKSAAFKATSDTNGVGYWFVFNENELPPAALPDIATFKSLAKGPGNMLRFTPFSGLLDGLNPDTGYVLYFAEEGSDGTNSAIRSVSFRTPPPPPPPPVPPAPLNPAPIPVPAPPPPFSDGETLIPGNSYSAPFGQSLRFCLGMAAVGASVNLQIDNVPYSLTPRVENTCFEIFATGRGSERGLILIGGSGDVSTPIPGKPLLLARNTDLVLNESFSGGSTSASIRASLDPVCTSTRVTILSGKVSAPEWIISPPPATGCPADALTPERSRYMVADGQLLCHPSALSLRGTYARLTVQHTQTLSLGAQYYTAAGYAPAGWFQNNAEGWSPLADPFLPLAIATGAGPMTLTLVDALDIRGIPGTELYIGLGGTADEMMMNRRYCGVFRAAP